MNIVKPQAARNGIITILVASALCAIGGEVLAGTMQTSPALRQAAITNCTTDVLRLCPTAIFDEQKVFACMQAKRAQLSPDCRATFDEGAKTVRR